MKTLHRCLVLVVSAAAPVLTCAADADSFEDLVKKAQKKQADLDWPGAATLWDQVVARNPTQGEFWEHLATCRYSNKEYHRAIGAYEKVLELRTGYPAVAAFSIARCYARADEKNAALDWLEKALKLGYRYLDAVRTSQDLKTLRNEPRFKELTFDADTKAMTRDDGWRLDLKFLAHEIKRLHYNPYRIVTREQFDAEVQKLQDAIPKMSDAAIEIGFMKLARLAGDGHTAIRPSSPSPTLPVRFFLFEEGVFITATTPDQADFAGSQLLKIGALPVEKALAALEPLISRDNPMGLKAAGPRLLTVPRILNALGLIPDADKVSLTMRGLDGKERTVVLSAQSGMPDATWVTARQGLKVAAPLYQKNRTAPYWFEFLAESKTVFCQYNAVRNDSKESFEKFCGRMFEFVEKNEVERLVLDLRFNGGGNTFLTPPLIHGLIRCPKVNQAGKLFVIVGRQTFSAAQNCSTDLEMHTKATFVGEPTGSSPNFIGETVPLTLPYSGMRGSISDLYWGRSWPMDYRIWIAPRLYAPPTFAALRANRDPALDAILATASSKQ